MQLGVHAAQGRIDLGSDLLRCQRRTHGPVLCQQGLADDREVPLAIAVLARKPALRRFAETLHGGRQRRSRAPAVDQPPYGGNKLRLAHAARGIGIGTSAQRRQSALERGLVVATSKCPPLGPLCQPLQQQSARRKVADRVDQLLPCRALSRVVAARERRGEMHPRVGTQAVGGLQQRRGERHPAAERGAREQLPEPAMEGLDRDRKPCGGNAFVELARRIDRRARRVERQAAHLQEVDNACVVGLCQLLQLAHQPRAHLLRRTARERDREDLAGRGAGQELPDDAAHQQPGLAAARAGLDHDGALRIAGAARERCRVDCVVVGKVAAHAASASLPCAQ
jgi:hypothetical protein